MAENYCQFDRISCIMRPNLMLKFLRNKHTQKKIYILLAVVIIPPFLMWGVSSSQKDSKTPSTLGTIEKQKISLREYLNSYKAIQHQVVLMYGEKAKEAASSVNYKGEAWDRLLLLYHAKQEKIKTSDSEVVQWIMSQPVFQSHGQFDDKLYKLYVTNYIRSNERDFEEETRDILTIEKILNKTKTETLPTDQEIKTLYSQENKQRDVAYGILSWESEKNNVQVSEDDIKNIYPIVKDKLTGPDKRPLSPEEVKEELKKIILKQKATDAAIAKLKAAKKKMEGNDLEKFLKDLGVDTRHAEKFKKGDVLPDVGASESVDKIIVGLKENEISDVFAATNGAAILKVVKDGDIDDKKFEAEKEAFGKKVMQEKNSEEVKALLGKLRNKLKIDLEVMKKIFPEEAKS